MPVMIKQQRILLLKRLDKLSADLKTAKDTAAAELLLEEMRNVGIQLQSLVRNSEADHEFSKDDSYKLYGSNGRGISSALYDSSL